MSEDTDRRSAWWKGQLSLSNVLAVGGVIVAVTAGQKAIESTNAIQDLKIAALEQRIAVAESTTVRREMYDQRLANIEEKVNTVDRKLDAITKAVR